MRRIFDDYVAAGHSMRQITRRLNADGVPSPTGKPVWGVSTLVVRLRGVLTPDRVLPQSWVRTASYRPSITARSCKR